MNFEYYSATACRVGDRIIWVSLFRWVEIKILGKAISKFGSSCDSGMLGDKERSIEDGLSFVQWLDSKLLFCCEESPEMVVLSQRNTPSIEAKFLS